MSSFRSALCHAFAIGPDPKTEVIIPEALLRLCDSIVALRLETVAIMALESLAPISSILSQPLYGALPLARLAGLAAQDIDAVARGLEDRRMPGLLAARLATLAAKRDRL